MLLLTFAVLPILALCNGSETQECVFTDSSGSGNILDLRAVKNKTLNGSDGSYNYFYTPCSNGLECTTETRTDTAMNVMSRQPDDICYVLSCWDNGQTQPMYDETDGTWRFEYMNGETC